MNFHPGPGRSDTCGRWRPLSTTMLPLSWLSDQKPHVTMVLTLLGIHTGRGTPLSMPLGIWCPHYVGHMKLRMWGHSDFVMAFCSLNRKCVVRNTSHPAGGNVLEGSGNFKRWSPDRESLSVRVRGVFRVSCHWHFPVSLLPVHQRVHSYPPPYSSFTMMICSGAWGQVTQCGLWDKQTNK